MIYLHNTFHVRSYNSLVTVNKPKVRRGFREVATTVTITIMSLRYVLRKVTLTGNIDVLPQKTYTRCR
jgi:hypothetical protein